MLEALSGMTRREPFAIHKAQGVSVTLPITNEELRAAARLIRSRGVVPKTNSSTDLMGRRSIGTLQFP